MTTARFLKTGSRIGGVELSDHAGYAEEGQDIVCAAVSASVDLTSCLLGDILGIPYSASVDSEQAVIRLMLPDILSESDEMQAQNALKALLVYLTDLKGRYPEYIDVMEV